MTYSLEFKRICIHSEKEKRECIKTSVNWKPSSSITTNDTVFGSHQALTASKWSPGGRYGHWWWVDLWCFGKRDMCGCHNRGNKDKCGSSPRRTSHKPLVMNNPSHSSMHTTTCTPTWLHGGWGNNDHTVFGFTLCFHCKHRRHFIIVQIFVIFFPHYHFSLKLYLATPSQFRNILKLRIAKIFKIFCN